jgi:hypothetical protein
VSVTRTVLAEIAAGTPTLADIARRTGLDRGVVEMAVHTLVRQGYVEAQRLSAGCPPQGCSTCASGDHGVPDCGADASSGGRAGPVLVSLSIRPH